MTGPPERSPQQRARAREQALAARRRRAEARAAVSEGRWSLVDLLDRCATDNDYARIRVRDALSALPGIGDVRSLEIMEDMGIAPSRRLRGLGSRQQAALRSWAEAFAQRQGRS
jgi:GNAT superfamily N-acetyltransferase